MLYIDLHLYTGDDATNEEKLFSKYASNINYVYYLSPGIKRLFVQHAAFEKKFNRNGVEFWVLKSPKVFKRISFLFLFAKLKSLKPNVILMHGMIDPFSLILAKWIIGSKTKIIVQNHAERPFQNLKYLLQIWASGYVHAFLFTSIAQSDIWKAKKIIKKTQSVFEVMEGSTQFLDKNKSSFKKNLHLTDKLVFLWVGRLDKNKDPLCILSAMQRFMETNHDAVLRLIYNSNELEKEVKEFVVKFNLHERVQLLGNMEHDLLEEQYNAADYFILGSHYEGSGYALCEAMACGCVPIVTKIPSFLKMLNNGECGYLFEPGNAGELLNILLKLNETDFQRLSELVKNKFQADLSFQAIAQKIESILYQEL